MHLWVGVPPAADQMWSRLSLPPLASCVPLGDHLRPPHLLLVPAQHRRHVLSDPACMQGDQWTAPCAICMHLAAATLVGSFETCLHACALKTSPSSQRTECMHGLSSKRRSLHAGLQTMHLTSWLRMSESRPPVLSVVPFQESAETRAEWPRSARICFTRAASQICTCALLVPTQTCLPSAAQATLVT